MPGSSSPAALRWQGHVEWSGAGAASPSASQHERGSGAGSFAALQLTSPVQPTHPQTPITEGNADATTAMQTSSAAGAVNQREGVWRFILEGDFSLILRQMSIDSLPEKFWRAGL